MSTSAFPDKLPEPILMKIISFLSTSDTYKDLPSTSKDFNFLKNNNRFDIKSNNLQYLKFFPINYITINENNMNDDTFNKLCDLMQSKKIKEFTLRKYRDLTYDKINTIIDIVSSSLIKLNIAWSSSMNIYLETINLNKLYKLQELNISGYQLTPDIMSELSILPLKHLTAIKCSITDDMIYHISNLPLEHLDLSYNDISYDGISKLNNKDIRYLNLSSCNIDDKCIKHLVNNFKQIQHLNIDGANITNDSIFQISRLRLLHYLSVRNCDIDTIAPLRELEYLEYLDISTIIVRKSEIDEFRSGTKIYKTLMDDSQSFKL